MKLLDGRQVAEYLQERHLRTVRSLGFTPELAIVVSSAAQATSPYVAAKVRYGAQIGAVVTVHEESAATILSRIKTLNDRPEVLGIIIQLPLDDLDLTDQVLAAVDPAKDVDGLGPDSPFDVATPKAVSWLLAAYNVELKERTIAVVGQGRLVGRPLADYFEASGLTVRRVDETTPQMDAVIKESDIVIVATGRAGLIEADVLKEGAVVIDCGAPHSELSEDAQNRRDVVRSPVPGGVGPMTVAALFDNLLIAAQRNRS